MGTYFLVKMTFSVTNDNIIVLERAAGLPLIVIHLHFLVTNDTKRFLNLTNNTLEVIWWANVTKSSYLVLLQNVMLFEKKKKKKPMVFKDNSS